MRLQGIRFEFVTILDPASGLVHAWPSTGAIGGSRSQGVQQIPCGIPNLTGIGPNGKGFQALNQEVCVLACCADCFQKAEIGHEGIRSKAGFGPFALVNYRVVHFHGIQPVTFPVMEVCGLMHGIRIGRIRAVHEFGIGRFRVEAVQALPHSFFLGDIARQIITQIRLVQGFRLADSTRKALEVFA